jgi:hypothetical protein
MGEDIYIFTKTLGIGHPNKLKFSIIRSSLLVVAIKTGEEPSIESHFSKESCIGVRVTKGINLPTNTWFDTKFFKNEVVTNHHVINHIFINGACFIMHGPSGINKLKLAISNEGPNISLHTIILVIPPHFEELHLYFHELSSGVGHK